MQNMQAQLPMQATVGLVNQAAQTAESQRALIQMQQQQGQVPGQSPQMHNSPPRVNGIPQPHGFPMQNMMAFNGSVNGISTPPMNGISSSPNQSHVQISSPQMGQAPYNQDQTSGFARLEASLRAQHPDMTNDQIMSIMTERVKQNAAAQHRQRLSQSGLAQSAMNAAAGAGGLMGNANGQRPPGVSNGPQGQQAYAQLLARQQENQQKQAEQARHAANALSGNTGGVDNRTPVQGHAHRNSSGSVQGGN